MSVLAAIGVLALLIVVHELGHFAAARLQNIHVNRFSIGFGPVLLKYQGPQTEYAIRVFPLGGFVGFPDDDPDSDIPPDDPDLLRNRPILDRTIVISAGVIANLIFAYFLLTAQLATIGLSDFNYQPGVAIAEVVTEPVTAAQKAGIEAGDIVLSINSQKLAASEKSLPEFMEKIQQSPDRPITLEIKRGEEILSLQVTPELGADGQGKIGVILSPNGELSHDRQNPITALSMGANEFQRLSVLTFQGFSHLILNFSETANQVAGPVKIVEIGASLARSDAGSLFQFGALISINLAIINILPLPALDGGQLAFLLIEGLRGKPLPDRIQDNIMQTGFVLLLGLGVFLIVRDTANLEVIQKLFQQ
ncbi:MULTISPECIES: RIP metalloprotease RseP [Spirulina sp. CCY15215]|uniref:RIP metalloprotease RseP n=1 Tax=Spirulina sp. CCY15215 TaxID=2767591 RepID=UPI0019528224|nr:RIP metalloprotease RseP [Spirulina major]